MCIRDSSFIEHFMPSAEKFKNQFPLHIAARNYHNAILKELLKIVDVNQVDENGQTALEVAFKVMNKEGVKTLINKSNIRINKILTTDGTALHMALKSGWPDVAEEILLSLFLDVNIQDSSGNTALHLLFSHYSPKLAKAMELCKKILLTKGSNPNLRNEEGMTALQCAASSNRPEYIKFCVKFAQKHKKRLDFDSASGGVSVLNCLARYSSNDAIKLVLSADINTLIRDKDGNTARRLIKSFVGKKVLLKREKKQLLGVISPHTENLLIKMPTMKMTDCPSNNNYMHYKSKEKIAENCFKVDVLMDALYKDKEKSLSSKNEVLTYRKIHDAVSKESCAKYIKYRALYLFFSKSDDPKATLNYFNKKIWDRSLAVSYTHLTLPTIYSV
eukprot:TRINITY_DN12316_c0_g2_i6.p1 TRINITY_DN12316_c0_g2~~TRINITY_DN12316_c0_g2_i6.p1  ORF type:complete len:388 (-),score=76.60 TRINITY_DN12316_c0_g2_i6:72-1235(-)